MERLPTTAGMQEVGQRMERLPRTIAGFLILRRTRIQPAFSLAEKAAFAKLAPDILRSLMCTSVDVDSTGVSSEYGFFLTSDGRFIQIACGHAQKLLSMILADPHMPHTQAERELPPGVKEKVAQILNEGTPTETSWRQWNHWGHFLFHARLLGSSLVAVTMMMEQPIPLIVFRQCQRRALTPKQTEVLLALARGETYKGAGQLLGVSAYTVIDHMRKLCDRFGVSNRDALIVHIASCELFGDIDRTRHAIPTPTGRLY